ncbi:helix-turn-helix domain-containing protein [Nesterenkonia xinjiangensis]|uniref:Excisionase family DNA binding protein n=1 Tax=Nesterenkonia xinjiangensis TaxID=225327 RepID=A0A7Z0GN77_9MICC|nr:helix-turn-helix domain-containing protein [Nesterenkonia xinjiangensis]NYJ79112.1 excisionase family DNA binding protein [Nesterenkonia xinjiangensis]
MTTPALERATVAPNPAVEDDIQKLAQFVKRAPSTAGQQAPCLVSPTGERQEIPAEVYDMLTLIVDALSAGRGVSIVPTDAQLTTQQAADHLGISRPTLVKLLEHGDIPFTKVGRHRRVKLEDLIDYENRARQERRQALDALTAEAAADGTYFTPTTSTSTR